MANIAQQPASLALTDAEQKEAINAANEKKQAEQDWLNSLKSALNAPASQAAEMQCGMKITFLQKEIAIARADALLWKHRASHGCPDCIHSSDFKMLERPPAKATRPAPQ
jgi:hypothetical protein